MLPLAQRLVDEPDLAQNRVRGRIPPHIREGEMARASTAPFEAIPGSLGGLGPAMVETLALALSPCPLRADSEYILGGEPPEAHGSKPTVRD